MCAAIDDTATTDAADVGYPRCVQVRCYVCGSTFTVLGHFCISVRVKRSSKYPAKRTRFFLSAFLLNSTHIIYNLRRYIISPCFVDYQKINQYKTTTTTVYKITKKSVLEFRHLKRKTNQNILRFEIVFFVRNLENFPSHSTERNTQLE